MAFEGLKRTADYYRASAKAKITGFTEKTSAAISRSWSSIRRGIISPANINELDTFLQAYSYSHTDSGPNRITASVHQIRRSRELTLDLSRIHLDLSTFNRMASLFSNYGCPPSIKTLILKCNQADEDLIQARLNGAFSAKKHQPNIIVNQTEQTSAAAEMNDKIYTPTTKEALKQYFQDRDLQGRVTTLDLTGFQAADGSCNFEDLLKDVPAQTDENFPKALKTILLKIDPFEVEPCLSLYKAFRRIYPKQTDSDAHINICHPKNPKAVLFKMYHDGPSPAVTDRLKTRLLALTSSPRVKAFFGWLGKLITRKTDATTSETYKPRTKEDLNKYFQDQGLQDRVTTLDLTGFQASDGLCNFEDLLKDVPVQTGQNFPKALRTILLNINDQGEEICISLYKAFRRIYPDATYTKPSGMFDPNIEICHPSETDDVLFRIYYDCLTTGRSRILYSIVTSSKASSGSDETESTTAPAAPTVTSSEEEEEEAPATPPPAPAATAPVAAAATPVAPAPAAAVAPPAEAAAETEGTETEGTAAAPQATTPAAATTPPPAAPSRTISQTYKPRTKKALKQYFEDPNLQKTVTTLDLTELQAPNGSCDFEELLKEVQVQADQNFPKALRTILLNTHIDDERKETCISLYKAFRRIYPDATYNGPPRLSDPNIKICHPSDASCVLFKMYYDELTASDNTHIYPTTAAEDDESIHVLFGGEEQSVVGHLNPPSSGIKLGDSSSVRIVRPKSDSGVRLAGDSSSSIIPSPSDSGISLSENRADHSSDSSPRIDRAHNDTTEPTLPFLDNDTNTDSSDSDSVLPFLD